MIDAAEIDTDPPAMMLVELRFMSDPDVPTDPSITAVPPDLYARNHVAVPVASADASAVIALNVRTPFETVPGVAANGNTANTVPVAAVAGFAGRVPDRTSM